MSEARLLCCESRPCHACGEAGSLGLCVGCEPDCKCARNRILDAAAPAGTEEGK